MSGGEGREIGERGVRIGAQRRPFEREASVRIGFRARQRGQRGDVALAVGDGGGKDDRGRKRRLRSGRLAVGESPAQQRGFVLGKGVVRGAGPGAGIAAKRKRPAKQGGGVIRQAFHGGGGLRGCGDGRGGDDGRGCGDRRGGAAGALRTVRAAQGRRDDESDDGNGHEDRGWPDPHALDPSRGPCNAFADEPLTPARAPLPPFRRGPAGLWERTRAARPRARSN